VFEQLLVLTAVMVGLTFARRVRRLESGQRGYMLLLAAVVCSSLVALGRGSRFLGVMAMAFAALTVLAPWVMEALARVAFSRGRLSLAVRMAGLRAMLMPGAGLSRQQEILRGLALLERDGVDQALGHFRGLAVDTEDGGELALINEQIVSMLFYGQRWDEGIAHYESRFHPRYAAVRPALALGLLRAYGESGQLDSAAGLLRALEDGPVGTDPRALGLVSQARLTFLAYAGATSPVAEALSETHRRSLGLSEASGALFRGIALARAGESERAQLELRKVETLAGSADDRVVDASRNAMAKLHGYAPSGAIELGPELQHYVDVVSERLELFLRVAPNIRRPGSLIVTPLLVVVCVTGYIGVMGMGERGLSLLAAGVLTPQLWWSGDWARAFTGLFAQADPIGMLLDVYAIWLAAPIVERLYGSGRVLLAALGGGALGLAAAATVATDPALVLDGGSLIAVTITAGALATLLPMRTPSMRSSSRRALALPLMLVFAAQAVAVVPGLLPLDVTATGLAVAAAFGVVWLGLLPPQGTWAALLRWLWIPLVALTVWATVVVARQDVATILGALPQQRIRVGAVTFEGPAHLESTERADVFGLGLPVQPGLVDAFALRIGKLVQLIAVTAASEDFDASAARESASSPSLLLLDPSLDRELAVTEREDLPPDFVDAYVAAGGDPSELRVFALRRNGADVGLVIDRRLSSPVGQPDGITAGIVAAPADALSHAPRLYARVLLGAEATP
jgi:hypothetical protein